MKRLLVCAVLLTTWASAQDTPGGLAIQPVPPMGSQSTPHFTPPAGSTDVGRYQVISIQDGNRNTFVMLLDTREGATWIYRPPQGNAVNGFWSDIPRLTYAPEFWRTIFNQPQPTATNAPPPTLTPPPTTPRR